jgi:hypothetical protein
MPNLFENASDVSAVQPDVVGSLNSGHQWAMDKANLDIKKQAAQASLQNMQDIHQEFQANMGEKQLGDISKLAQMPNGPAKSERIDAYKDFYERAGLPVHDSLWESTKDEAYQTQWQKLIATNDQFKLADPDGFKSTMANLVGTGVMGSKDAIDLIDKLNGAATTAMAAKLRANAMLEATGMRVAGANINNVRSTAAKFAQLDASNAKSGQQTYDKAVSPITFSLDGALRAKGLIEQAQDPNTPPEKKVALTKQIRSVLSNEEARLVTGKQNFGEGTAANMSVDTFAAKVKDFLSKIDENPKDTLSDDNLKQMGNFYDELSGAYMEAHDRMANSKLGGALPAQRKAILGRAQALQKQYGKKFGTWKGPGLETGDEASAAGAGTPSPNGAPAQPSAAGTAGGSPAPAQSPEAGANQAVQVDPIQMQKAGQIYQTYLKTKQSDPVKAGLILQKMRQSFPDAIKQRLGIQ